MIKFDEYFSNGLKPATSDGNWGYNLYKWSLITLLTTGTWKIIPTLTYLPPDIRPFDEGVLTIGFL